MTRFRWVACQLDTFKDCLNPTSLEKALKSLPKTLDETYERILCSIKEKHRDYVRKVLYWLTYSERTLRLEEVAEIVALDARREPRFNPENRFFDSKEILVICSSLVSVFTGKGRAVSDWEVGRNWDVPCIKLAHFSVKEYLTSLDVRNGPAKMYAISRELANTSIAESCLAMLLHFDKRDSLTSQNVEIRFPLAEYAAFQWLKHAHDASWDNDYISNLVSELFLNRDTLENWIRLHNPEEPWNKAREFSRPSTNIGPSIYYASQAGLHEQVKIVIENGANVNAPGGEHGNALRVASYNGHKEIVHLLLAHGADVNVRGGEFGTALQAAAHKGHQQIMQILVDGGADVNAQGGEYGSALQAACLGGDPQTVQILLDRGADVNAQGGIYGSALQAACHYGDRQTVQILLDRRADVNAHGGVYGNALQAACVCGDRQTVQILLDRGADINAQGGFGSALQAA